MKALLERIRKILRSRRTRQMLTRLVSGVAAIIVFITTYALVLPAITLEQDAFCGIPEHQHTDACYEERLVCEIPEGEGHQHDASCYEKFLICGQEVHVHSTACYQQESSAVVSLGSTTVVSTAFGAFAEPEPDVYKTGGSEYDAGTSVTSAADSFTGGESVMEEPWEEEADSPQAAAGESGDEVLLSQDIDAEGIDAERAGGAAADGNLETPGSGSSANMDADTVNPEDLESQDSEEDKTSAAAFEEDADSHTERVNNEGESLDLEPGDNLNENNGSGSASGTSDSVAEDTSDVEWEANGSTADTANREAKDAASAGTQTEETNPAAGTEDAENDSTTNVLPESVETEKLSSGYVPELDSVEFGTVLNKRTDFYYFHPEEGQEIPASSAEVTEWKKVKKGLFGSTKLESTDLVKMFLSYTIPAGALNETNQVARYRLPSNIHLTDEQIIAINGTENGMSTLYADASAKEDESMAEEVDENTMNDSVDEARAEGLESDSKVEDSAEDAGTASGTDEGDGADIEAASDTSEQAQDENAANYQKYLGVEAIEGTRTPGETLKEGAQEYISAIVKAENVFDDEGLYGEKGAFLGQDLIFIFTPYSIEKNQTTYNADGDPLSAGEKITGWFACDFNMSQIDWVEEDTDLDKSTVEKTAEVVFVEKDSERNVKEISRTLKLVDKTVGQSDPAGDGETGAAAEIAATAATASETAATDETALAFSGNTSEQADPEDTEKGPFKSGILTADGDGYKITLDYTEEAKIPENAELSVREITAETDREAYEACLEQARQQMAADEKTSVDRNASRFFDIEILVKETDSDGERETRKIEPSAPVDVNIHIIDDYTITDSASADEKTSQGDPAVLHFAEQGVEQIDSTVKNSQGQEVEKDKSAGKESEFVTEISFEAESFSIYGVVYTVDFEYEVDGTVYQFSMPGGGFVSFSDLVEVLGIANQDVKEDFVAEKDADFTKNEKHVLLRDIKISEATQQFIEAVDSIQFSTPSLLSVSKVNNDTTVSEIKHELGLKCEYSIMLSDEDIDEVNAKKIKAGDWALISLKPFQTQEYLTITMKNRDTYTIEVTDGQVGIDAVRMIDRIKGVGSFADSRQFKSYGNFRNSNSPAATKTLVPNDDGTYTLTLSVSAPAQSTSSSNRANVVVIFDSSNSMYSAVDTEDSYFKEDSKGCYGTDDGVNFFPVVPFGTVVYRTDENGNMIPKKYEGKRYKPVPGRMGIAENCAKELGKKLLQFNENYGEGTVELAFVEFATKVKKVEQPTQDLTTYEGWVEDCFNYVETEAKPNHVLGGTNWEGALLAADGIEFDDDPVYIVFVSDGNPTCRISKLGYEGEGEEDYNDVITGGLYGDPVTDVLGNGLTDPHGWDYKAACNEAQTLLDNGKYLYNIGIFGDADRMKNLPGTDYFSGTDQTSINAAFDNIVNSLSSRVGYTDVSVTDGITSMTSTAIVGSGRTQDFSYKLVDKNGNEMEFPEALKTASYAESLDNDKESGRIHWNLGENYFLIDGATYSVSFVVWPDQDSYDLVADLNNGKRTFDQLNEVEASQVEKVGNTYNLKTNTSASASFTKATEINGVINKDTPDVIYPPEPDPMILDDTKVTVQKKWNDSLAESEYNELMQNNDFQIRLNLMREGEDYLKEPVIIDKPENYMNRLWPENDPDGHHISTGLMVSEQNARESDLYDSISNGEYPTCSYNGKTYYILDPGYDYYFEENVGSDKDYHFELQNRIFHPMVVDGEEKDVTFNGDEVEDMQNLETLTAVNSLKGGINIYKKLEDENGNEILTDQTCVFRLHGSIKKDGAGTRLEYRLFGDEYTDETGTAGKSEKKIIADSSDFTLEIRAKDWLRIINVPSGYTYSFYEETPDGVPYTFKSIEGEAVDVNGEDVTVPDPGITVSDDGKTLNGTSVSNAAQNIIITNKGIGKKLILKKVGISEDDPDQNQIDLGNVSFTIYEAAGTNKDQKGEIVTIGEGDDAVELKNLLSDDITGEFFSGVLPYGTYLIEEDEVPAEYYHMGLLRLTIAADGVTLTQATEGETTAVIEAPQKEENAGDTEVWTVKAINVKKTGTSQGTTTPEGDITLKPHKQIDYLGDGGIDSDSLTTAYQSDENAKNDLYRLYMDMTFSNKASDANIIFVEDWSSSMTNTDMGDNRSRYQHMQEALTKTDGFIDSVLEEGSGNMLTVVKFSDYRDTHNGIADGTGVVVGWTTAAEAEAANNTIKNSVKETINQAYVNTPPNNDGYQETVGHVDQSRWTNYQAGLEMIKQQVDALPSDRKDKQTYVFFMSDGLPTVYGTQGNERGGYIPAWMNNYIHPYWPDANIKYSEAFVYGKEKYQNLVGQGNTKGVIEMTKSIIDTFKSDENYSSLIINAIGFAGNMPNDIQATDISRFYQDGNQYPKSRISNNNFSLPSTNGYLQYNSVLRYLADGRGEYRNAANGDQLAQALKEMFEQKPITQVEISDTLSDFVELYGKAPDFTVTKNGAKLTVTINQDGSYSVKDGSKSVGRIIWNSQTKEVKLDFEDNLAYENGDKYVLSFNIQASSKAYEAYAASRSHDGTSSGYNAFGDKDTDYGTNVTSFGEEGAQIGHPGFRSNKSAELTYKYGTADKTESYPYPVIQVGETSLDIEKQWVGNGGHHPEGVEDVKFKLWAENPVTGAKTQVTNPSDSHGLYILSKDQDWKLTIHHLNPKVLDVASTNNAEYKAIKYTLEEISVPDNYTASYVFERTESSDPAVFENITSRYEAVGKHIYEFPTDVTNEASAGSGKIVNTLDENEISIIIRKTDNVENSTNYLDGAVFKLMFRPDSSGTFTNVSNESVTQLDAESKFIVPKAGITLTGLIDGEYRLEEISSPEGYVITNSYPVTFTVSGGDILSTAGTITSVRYSAATSEKDAEFIIPNEPGAALPNTGGPGTNLIYLIGFILTMLTGSGIVIKRRKEEAA